jgi:hypothetical protein
MRKSQELTPKGSKKGGLTPKGYPLDQKRKI